MLKINIYRNTGNNVEFYFTGDIEPFYRQSTYICKTTFFQVYSSSCPELDEIENTLYIFGCDVTRDQELINADIKTFIKINTTIHLFNKYAESVQNAM